MTIKLLLVLYDAIMLEDASKILDENVNSEDDKAHTSIEPLGNCNTMTSSDFLSERT